MDPTVYALGSLVYTYRIFSKSVPLKRMASSKNIFVWFCGVLICQRGLIPRRTKKAETCVEMRGRYNRTQHGTKRKRKKMPVLETVQRTG